MKYTFSDEEEGGSDALSTRRSNRQSGLSTPAEPARPTVTASGRQVRSRYGGAYGETMLSGHHDHGHAPSINGLDGVGEDDSTRRSGRATRNKGRRTRPRAEGDSSTEGMNDESDATSSGQEWDGGYDDEGEDHADDGTEEEEMDEDISEEDELAMDEGQVQPRSLVVTLRYSRPTPSHTPATPREISSIPETMGLSDQAPPPEANPFAVLAESKNANSSLSNGFTPATYDATSRVPQNDMIEDPSFQSYDRARSLI